MSFSPAPLAPLDPALAQRLRVKVDGKAKPLGALGRIEALAVQIGLVQQTEAPRIERVEALVFAGDHGLNEEGVSAYPSAVTAAMVATFLAGRASVNAFAAACGVDVVVVDAGVDADLPAHPRLIDAKVRRGTRNAAREPALTAAELDAALTRGAAIAAESPAEALIVGEMGIGNTAAAALIMHRLAPAPLSDCVGAGAGHDAAGLARKTAALERAAARSSAQAPLDILAEFGGLEIAMMAGAFLGGAASGKLMVVDGFISSAAALAAVRLQPALRERLVFAHVSAERGHRLLLAGLKAEPLLDLGLRLGEGSAGVLVAPMLRAAARLMTDTASLDDVLAGRLACVIRQARLFLCALRLLTRLPTPAAKGFAADDIARSAPYYPVVGWIVGGLCAAAFLGASRVWPGWPAAVLAVAAGLLVTGGFHEDGLADAADGLGGGLTRERRLEIMKDSRLGSYGALALWAVLTLKAALLAQMAPWTGALALMLAHGAARSLAAVAMAALPYAGDAGAAKLTSPAARVRPWEAVVSAAFGFAPLFLLLPLAPALAAVGFASVGAAIIALAAWRLIGGYTGDVLGAIEQAAEVGLLLGIGLKFVM